MNFCDKCGSELNGANFCSNCGASFPDENGAQIATNTNTNKNIKIIAAVVLALVVVIVGIFCFGGRSYKGVVKDYVKATQKYDAKGMINLLPGKVVDYVVDEQYDGDKKDMIKTLQSFADIAKEMNEDQDRKLKSYKIVKTEDMDKEELEALEEEYEDVDLKIKAGKKVTVKLK